MRKLLKTLFYWDAPAKGAVFASVLFWLGGWCLATVFVLSDGLVACSVLPRMLQTWHKVEDPLAWQHLLLLAGFAILIYYLIVTGHFYHTLIREKWPWGSWIFTAVIFVGAVIFLCLFWERMFFIFLYSMFCWVIPLCCRPRQWRWLIPAGFAPALIASPFIAFSDILSTLLDTVGSLAVPSRLFASAAQLTVPSIVLGILCCFCCFKAFADAAGKPFRAMFGKGAATVASLFLLTYGVSLGMAYSAHCSTERHVAEMERFFGRPVNAQGLKELYYQGRKPDAAFWRKLLAVKLDSDPDFREPAAEYPAEKLGEYRKKLESSAGLRELETMFESDLPATDRNFRRGNIFGIALSELNSVRIFIMCEAWRVRFAVADRNVPAALAAMERMVKVRNYLALDPSMQIPSLVMIHLEDIRLNALEWLLSSGLLTDSQLIEQRGQLAKFRKQLTGIHACAVYGEAVAAMDLCDMFIYGCPATNPEREIPIPPFYPYRWLFPAAWYQFTRIRDIFAVNFTVTDFTRIPFDRERKKRLESTAYRAAGMLLTSWGPTGNKFHSLSARYLAMETLIGVELEKRRTGKYPDTLANPPIDPFGHPLLYRHGKVPFLPVPGNGASLMSSPRKPVMVEGVMVWSRGPDGEDNQGLSRWRPPAKKNLFDDVRALKILPAGK